MSNASILNKLLATATIELFEGYSYSVKYAGLTTHPPEQPEIAGVISFFGSELTGTLALATSKRLIDAKAAATPGVVSSTDWLAELANQLLGRLKHLLISQSATIYLGTPMSVTGRELAFSGTASTPESTFHVFQAAQGTILIWLDLEYVDGFEFHPNDDSEDGAAAGETILF